MFRLPHPGTKRLTLLMVMVSVARLRAADADLVRHGGTRAIGSHKILFVDDRFIEKVAGAEDLQARARSRKTGERLIESEYPWESATLNWFSVVRDGEKYRMWYECYDMDGWPTPDDTSFCYAESTDGIHWTKPKLGLFSYQGSKDNNILFREIGADKHRSRVHGSCVFIDPSAPPEARYKCVSQGLFQGIGDRPYYVAGMTSPDGLNWTRYDQPICQVFADSQYSGFWDETQHQYRDLRTRGRPRRTGDWPLDQRPALTAFAPLTESSCAGSRSGRSSGLRFVQSRLPAVPRSSGALPDVSQPVPPSGRYARNPSGGESRWREVDLARSRDAVHCLGTEPVISMVDHCIWPTDAAC